MHEILVAVASTPDRDFAHSEARLGEGLSGRAALSEEPLVINNYQRTRRATALARDLGIGAAVGVPLRHEGRLLGTMVVASDDPAKKFSEDDARVLLILSSLGSAALVGLERARLDGVLLAARTAAHEINNHLMLTVGYVEMLATRADLSPEAHAMALEALGGAEGAAAALVQLQNVVRLEEVQQGTSIGAVLDLDRSTRPSPGRGQANEGWILE